MSAQKRHAHTLSPLEVNMTVKTTAKKLAKLTSEAKPSKRADDGLPAWQRVVRQAARPSLTKREWAAREQAERRHLRRTQVAGYQRMISDWRASGYRFVLVLEGGSTLAHRARPGPCVTAAIVRAIEHAATLTPANTLTPKWRCPDCIRRMT